MSKGIGTVQSLQDVPLSNTAEEAIPCSTDDPAPSQKSNSLKRFFKMPHKRQGGGNASVSETKLDTDNKEEASNINSRFRLRLGNMHKYESHMELHSTNGGEKADSKNTAHKSNLKKSLSNYWHSVFKRNQAMSEQKMDEIDVALHAAADELARIDDEAKGEPVVTESPEERIEGGADGGTTEAGETKSTKDTKDITNELRALKISANSEDTSSS